MTIERLEEISAWAERHGRICAADGAKQASEDFADLARCARAWATLERHTCAQLMSGTSSDGTHWAFMPDRIIQGFGVLHGATAIEAVEAVEAAGAALEGL